MIEISRKSWHYCWFAWLMKTFTDHNLRASGPQSICSYFWTFVLINIWVLIVILVIVGFFPLWGPIYAGFWLWGKYKLRQERLQKAAGLPEPTKQPSLVLLWMKAKKDKVCPLIKYVD